MSVYRLTSVAEQDILEIWLYIARENLSAADTLIDRFTDTFEQLSSIPQLGEAVEQYGPKLRCFSSGNYVIYYRSIDNGIEVCRLLHGARRREDEL